MTKPMIRIHNIETDEIIDREMNDEEFAVYQKNLAIEESLDATEAQNTADKAALLERLGISESEAKLLLS